MTCNYSDSIKFDGKSHQFKRALWFVIGINAIMFFLELSAGFIGQSQALKADALDFLGDTVTYAMTLAVLGSSIQLRSKVALVKGISLGLLSLGIIVATVYRLFVDASPAASIMGSVALLALIANLSSVLLLMKYRDGDANVRSVWLCSRNDAIGNIAVMVAAGAVWLSASAWPDLMVALLMASLFLHSSLQIISQARQELKAAI
ncbi:MAG: cation transporter [Motiliproteus sp.]